MNKCAPCEARRREEKQRAFDELKTKALKYAREKGHTSIALVQTRNKPGIRRIQDLEESSNIIEILFVD